MNINEQMDELGKMGSVGYAAADDVVDQLTTRARRKRATRQGAAAGIGAVAAMALGIASAQVLIRDTPEDDAARNDRNVIENGLDDSLFSKYDVYNGYTNDTKAEIEKIYEELQIAQQIQAELLEKQKAAEEAQAAKEAAEKAAKEAAEKDAEQDKDDDGGSSAPTCETIDKGYKIKSPETGCEWEYQDDWYEDTIANAWMECDGSGYGDTHTAGRYNCNTGKWELNSSYFLFTKTGEIYKCIQYYDEASGSSSWGAWSHTNVGGGDIHGYDNKMIECSSGRSTSSSYVYVGSGAWSGSTCTGPVETKKGAPHRLSCDVDKTGGANGTGSWYLADSNYKWFNFDGCKQYYHKNDNPTTDSGTWEWTGSEWQVIPGTEPTPSA